MFTLMRVFDGVAAVARQTVWLLTALVMTVLTSLQLAAGTLEAYVSQPDKSYTWQVSGQRQIGDMVVVEIDLSSQTWQNILWRHTLYIAKPAHLRNPRTALLRVVSRMGEAEWEHVRQVAERAGTLVAIVTDVPNQPLFGGKQEDALIALTFDQYLKTGDSTWPLLLPMVNSAVRAMDTVQAWAVKTHKIQVERFVVTGVSKRGWTAWLTGAVDTRVCAIAPVVIDTLNMKAQTEWAKRVYGSQSEKISDYTDLNLVEKMDVPEMVKLRGLVDPYSYRSRYTMPKLLILGTNDPYWTVDALRHYWDDLPLPKIVYQAPNAGHRAGSTPEAVKTLTEFLRMMAEGQAIPAIRWQMQGNDGARVSVTSDCPVARAWLWQASSPTRDFRQAQWQSHRLELDGTRRQVAAAIETPAKGFVAFMVELAFTVDNGEYCLSTQVQVTPDTF